MQRAGAPAVVDDGRVAHSVVVPVDELGGAELQGRVEPVAVGEDERGAVARDQILELRHHVVIDIVGDERVGVLHPDVARVGPFGQRKVEPHPQPLPADGGGEFRHDVAARARRDAVPLRLLRAVPQTVAVVVFGDQHHVFRTCGAKQATPFVWLPFFGLPIVG